MAATGNFGTSAVSRLLAVAILGAIGFILCLGAPPLPQDDLTSRWNDIETADDLRRALEPYLSDDSPQSKQLPPFSSGTTALGNPCKCVNGVCGCCVGAFRMSGCANLTYIPEDFAFEFRMIMNNRVLHKSRLSGKNPPPVCVHPPRFDFVEFCANFYDVYFFGRNMHVCMEMNGNFEGFELFSRSFDCMRIGEKGVKFLKPGEEISHPTNEAEVDTGDDIDEYDEVVV